MLDANSLIAPALTALLTGLGVYVGMSNQIAVIKTELVNLTKQEVERLDSKVDGLCRIGGTD